jgi:hypothetical protein
MWVSIELIEYEASFVSVFMHHVISLVKGAEKVFHTPITLELVRGESLASRSSLIVARKQPPDTLCKMRS